MRAKFGDMEQGTHFSDGRRKFIKLQTILPSGIPIQYLTDFESGRGTHFNAVDYTGVSANCPDWVEFELL